jgi:hypothetical protein
MPWVVWSEAVPVHAVDTKRFQSQKSNQKPVPCAELSGATHKPCSKLLTGSKLKEEHWRSTGGALEEHWTGVSSNVQPGLYAHHRGSEAPNQNQTRGEYPALW